MITFLKKALFVCALFISFSNLFAQSTTLVISQVYGGGGNKDAAFTNDFIELYNLSEDTVLFSGSLQYAAATSSSWSLIPLTEIKVAPAAFYLIALNSSAAIGEKLPLADQYGDENLSSSSGKIILCSDLVERIEENPNDKGIVDKVGYGSASGFEGAFAASGINSSKAVIRTPETQDTDENMEDFAVGTPIPRNSNYNPGTITGNIEPLSGKISIFPTPSVGKFSITAPGTIKEVSVKDLSGNEVLFYSKQIETRLKGILEVTVITEKGVFVGKTAVL